MKFFQKIKFVNLMNLREKTSAENYSSSGDGFLAKSWITEIFISINYFISNEY